MRLVDCFVKPLAYTAYVVGTGEGRLPCFERISQDIRNLLAESEKLAANAGFSPEEYSEARFAVCAWIDEAVLCSGLPDREIWMGELLQRKLYGTTRAGEEFYDRLQGLNDAMLQVRDVYYHCLALGFKGRFFEADLDEELAAIKKQNLQLLRGNGSMLSAGNLMGFFPDSYPQNQVMRRRQLPRFAFSTATLLMILTPVVIVILTYLSYNHSLDGLVQALLRLELR